MKQIKLKICGMKHNVPEVVALEPDYIGFIFFDKSPRNFEGTTITISKRVKRVGVFVDAPISFIEEKIKKHELDIIQLHGDETVEYIELLKNFLLDNSYNKVEIWNVFSVGNNFDFNKLAVYETLVDKFLFDTKGKDKGGNGFAFNWSLLHKYPSSKPFILSGGISLENISEVKKILQSQLPMYAIDVNSKFEIKPGLKDISALKELIKEIPNI